jgi:two-component system, chemotaxis family, protein-glutamate methylesterase/glutaminase
MALRVLVVDDSAYHRRALSRVIAAAKGLEVAGTAGDGEEAIRKVVTLKPDLLTLSLELQRLNCSAFLRWLMRAHPLPTLVVSSRESAKNVFRALELGAADFVLRPVSHASQRPGLGEDEVIAKLRGIAAARPERLAVRAERPAPRVEDAAVQPLAPKRAGRDATGRYRCVAIGASTGGPPALQQVLAALPPDFPAGVVIAQHMPAGFTRKFAARLDRLVGLRVREAGGGEELEPGLVLLAPGGMNLVLERGVDSRLIARVEPPGREDRHVPSVDRLLTSAARACGSGLLSVVLTGMGDDGAAGIRATCAAGGLTVAEAEESCVVYGMPREAVRTGAVQRVLPLSEIGAAIAREVLRA